MCAEVSTEAVLLQAGTAVVGETLIVDGAFCLRRLAGSAVAGLRAPRDPMRPSR
jgi:hypothetical protein